MVHGAAGQNAHASAYANVRITEAARHAFHEQLRLCRELVVLPAACDGLAGLAAVAAVCDDLDRAARLCGATAAHRYGKPRDPVDARLDATFFEPARTRCGADVWDAALREGAALNFEDAITYALDERRPPAADPASTPTPTGQAH